VQTGSPFPVASVVLARGGVVLSSPGSTQLQACPLGINADGHLSRVFRPAIGPDGADGLESKEVIIANMEETICEMCEALIFAIDYEDNRAIWSHLDESNCDDPVPAF